MLEKLIKGIGQKIIKMTLVGTLLLGSGCATYNTMSSNLIQPVTSIEIPIERQIDYSKLTWQEAIKYVQTPKQAQDYLDKNFKQRNNGAFFIPGLINTSEIGGTFKKLHEKGYGTCFDYTIASAALLSDNNYPPLILAMRDGLTGGHTVMIYRNKNGYGAIGNTPLPPKYHSVKDLVRGFQKEYKINFSGFFIVNLNENFPDKQWIDGEMDLYKPMPYNFQKME
jgi:hypothetical protein